jgi:hypothetical protein
MASRLGGSNAGSAGGAGNVTDLLVWHERPRDEANLFNPAFLAQLVERTAYGYGERSSTGIPWPLIFLALPVVLHKETREALPANINTSMAAWTRDHVVLVASLPERARALRPLVTEALLFGLAHGTVQQDRGFLTPGGRARRSRTIAWREPTDDFRDCATRASFFGRWAALSGLPATVFALWGVRP